jgi:hypothetical protein
VYFAAIHHFLGMASLRFTTIRLGVVALDVGGQVVELDARILLDADGRYRFLLSGELSEPLASVEDAVRRVEVGEPVTSVGSRVVRWRPDLIPQVPDEAACPICGAPMTSTSRYPRPLCPACVREATDAGGRPLRFFNTHLGTGFEARYADDGTPAAGEICFVRGVTCRAAEAYFGGIVVQPILS